MRSARSWFNGTLYKKNLTRFWPIWGVYLIIWLFLFPISLILNNDGNNPAVFARRGVLQVIPNLGLGMAVVFSLLAACAVWSYLCNNRAVCLMHTLPIRREGLFLTNFLSGMTFLAGPNLLVFLLTLLAEAGVGAVNVGSLAMWFFSVTLMELAFFCFATFCAMFTGHILGLPAFYAILNVLAAGLVWLLDLTLSRFVFGYTGIEGLWRAAEWLTPVWKLADNLEVRQDVVNGTAAYETAWLSGLGYILVYAILGLILAGLALAVYRRRDMERVGDVVTVAWMRPVFQYGVAFCCALAFGSLLDEIFRGSLPEGAWTLLAFMLLCGAVGYFIARMLLEKSFRVFHCWKGCVPFLAALVALVCVMEFDLTGFERRVPAESEVASVSIWRMMTKPYDSGDYAAFDSADPEVIRAVLAAHQAIAENKDAIESSSVNWEEWAESEEGYTVQTSGMSGFEVMYTLKDGGTLSRDYAYNIPISVKDLSDPESLTAKLDALVNQPPVMKTAYGISGSAGESLRADDLIEITLSNYILDSEDGPRSVAVSREAYARVYDAVMADLEEGNLGRRYLMDDEERMNNCFVNDLKFTFYERRPEEVNYGFTNTVTEVIAETRTVTVTLQTTAQHTLAALREAGVLTGPVNLFTQAQREAAGRAWEENGERWTGIDGKDFAWATIGG